MTNVVWHEHAINKKHRQKLNGHRSCCLWFTGLSGSGKSTIATIVEEKLHKMFDVRTYVLDGDNVRHGLCGDLGFDEKDRVENIRRVGEVSKLFVDAGMITITAFISPFRADRAIARQMMEDGEFIEIYVETSLEECEKRDPKGLYKKARGGEIAHFTGIDSPYEAPEAAEITVNTGRFSAEQAADLIIDYLRDNDYIGPDALAE